MPTRRRQRRDPATRDTADDGLLTVVRCLTRHVLTSNQTIQTRPPRCTRVPDCWHAGRRTDEQDRRPSTPTPQALHSRDGSIALAESVGDERSDGDVRDRTALISPAVPDAVGVVSDHRRIESWRCCGHSDVGDCGVEVLTREDAAGGRARARQRPAISVIAAASSGTTRSITPAVLGFSLPV